MSQTRQVAYNTIIQVVARVITTLLSVVAFGYLARYLGVEGYGQYNLVFAYLSLFGVIVDFGFFLLQVREITKTPEKESEILGNVLGMKLALSVVVFLLAYGVALTLYDDPLLLAGIAVGAISQTALALSHVPTSLFQARLQMQYVALMGVVARAVYLAAILWAIHIGVSVVGMIWVISVVNLASFAWQHLWASRLAPIVPRWDMRYWKTFVIDAFPLGMATVLAMVYFRIDTVLLSFFTGSYEVGIYGAPYKIVEVILTIPTIFMSSVFPVITRALETSPEQAQKVFRKAFDFSALMGVPIGFGVTAIATSLMVALAGPEFAESGPVLQWLVWAAVLSFFGAVLNYTIIAAGQQKIMLWPYLAGAVFNVAANLIVIPKFSYMGAAIVTVATELLVGVWTYYLVVKLLKFTPTLGVFFKSLLAGLMVFVALWYFDSPNLYLNIALGGAVYTVMIIITRAIPLDIYKEVLRLR